MSQNDCLWAWSEHQHVTRPNPQLMMIFSFFFSFLLSLFCVLLLSTPSDVTSPLPLTIRFWLHFFFIYFYPVRLNVLIFFPSYCLLCRVLTLRIMTLQKKEIFMKCGWNWNLIFLKVNPCTRTMKPGICCLEWKMCFQWQIKVSKKKIKISCISHFQRSNIEGSWCVKIWKHTHSKDPFAIDDMRSKETLQLL